MLMKKDKIFHQIIIITTHTYKALALCFSFVYSPYVCVEFFFCVRLQLFLRQFFSLIYHCFVPFFVCDTFSVCWVVEKRD